MCEVPSVPNAAACAGTLAHPPVPRAQVAPAEAEGREGPGLSSQSPCCGDDPVQN